MSLLFSKRFPPEDYSMEKGQCPFDLARVHYLKLREKELDISLLGRAYPLSIRVCPFCLLASSENDFLSGIHIPDTGTMTGALNSRLNSLAGDLALWLPLRLKLAMTFLESLNNKEFLALVDRRRSQIEQNLQLFLTTSFRNLQTDAIEALIKHLIQMARAKLDPLELIGKLMANYHAPENIPDNDPVAHMVAHSANPTIAAMALLYGPLVAGFDADLVELFRSENVFTDTLFTKLALFHLDLERLVILMAYANSKPRLRSELNKNDLTADPTRFIATIESHIQSEHSAEKAGRAQRGYHYLNMGRSHYKSARLCLDLHGGQQPGKPDVLTHALFHMDRAWAYLELSLIAEKYPEFEPQERPLSLNQKGRAKVPFFFGEFGVRLMLCWIYNEMGRLAASGIATSKTGEALAEEIYIHWVKIHGKLRELDFGGFDDPKAVELLIPRLMVMAKHCFHSQIAETLRKLIATNQERLYSRYNAEVRKLAEAQ